MEFFIDNSEIEKQFQEIFKKVMILRNGETHHEMSKYGLKYQKSLGVTIVNLRELASCYKKNHLLAHKLWTKGFRETKILASLLDEVQEVNEEQVERWFTEMDSNELLEQVSMNLLLNLPDISQYIKVWLESKSYKKVLCAIMVLGRIAMLKREEDHALLYDSIDLIPENIDELYLRNHLKRTLGKIVRVNVIFADKITLKVKELMSKDENWQDVWADLKYELEL
jgi:3-methyladenine DNA glycosylase AlkD